MDIVVIVLLVLLGVIVLTKGKPLWSWMKEKWSWMKEKWSWMKETSPTQEGFDRVLLPTMFGLMLVGFTLLIVEGVGWQMGTVLIIPWAIYLRYYWHEGILTSPQTPPRQ